MSKRGRYRVAIDTLGEPVKFEYFDSLTEAIARSRKASDGWPDSNTISWVTDLED